MTKANGGSRQAYADRLRVLAMLAVIVIHVSAGWMEALPVGTADWTALNVWNSLSRWSVPVFVMCSGMFLLDPKKDLSLSTLFFRYLLRMAAALLFWGMAYFLLHQGLAGKLSLLSIPQALYAVMLGNTETHLWYLPMMAGLYLLTPLLRAFVRGAGQRDFHWFFLLYLLLMMVLPLFLRLRGSQTVELYANRMNLNFTLAYPPLAYVGYFLGGYYLRAYPLNPPARAAVLLLGAGGGAATIWGTALLSHRAGGLDIILYSYLSPGVCAMAVAVFVLFQSLPEPEGRRTAGRWAGPIAACGFGVYLSHVAALTLLRYFGLATPSIPTAAAVPLLTLVIFLPSFALSWLLRKLPVIGRYLT